MKNIFLFLLLFVCNYSMNAQDLTIKSDFVFEIKEGFDYAFDAEKVFLRPYVTIHSTEGTAQVQGVLVNELDEKLMTIATVNYEGQTVGGRNKMLNFDEVNAAHKLISPLNKGMLNVDRQITIIDKLLPTASKEQQAQLDSAKNALVLMSTDYAMKLMDIGLPPEPIYSHDLTFGLFTSEHFDWETQALTQAGVNQLLSTFISVEGIFDEAIDDFEEKHKYGVISDYVNPTPIIKHHVTTGDGFKENGCHVLYEGEQLSVKSRLADVTYTVGRGECKGRTNNNGDKFVIVGNVTATSGVRYEGGFYVVTDDNFSITVMNDFNILKGDAGQYMVFEIESSTGSKTRK